MNIRPIKCEKCGKKLSLFEGNICLECEEKAIQALEQEPCTDSVSIEAVIEWLKDKDIIKLKSQEENARKELQQLYSVNPQPKTGHWVEVLDEEGFIDGNPMKLYHYECSECRCEDANLGANNYCPNCGARMESEK